MIDEPVLDASRGIRSDLVKGIQDDFGEVYTYMHVFLCAEACPISLSLAPQLDSNVIHTPMCDTVAAQRAVVYSESEVV